MSEKRRFPAPWRVERTSEDCFCVRDANGIGEKIQQDGLWCVYEFT
jgi:hypothetical protein